MLAAMDAGRGRTPSRRARDACGRSSAPAPGSEVDRALRTGALVRFARALRARRDRCAPRRAHAVNGVLSLTSAALHHGWEVAPVPSSRTSLLPASVGSARRASRGHRRCTGATCPPDDRAGIATSKPQDPHAVPAAAPARRGARRRRLRPARRGRRPLRRVAREVRGPGCDQVRAVAARGERTPPTRSSRCCARSPRSVPGLDGPAPGHISSAHVWARTRTSSTHACAWSSRPSPSSGTATGPAFRK